MKQIKKMAQRGLLDPEKEDPFALFVASTNIRYCYYSETHKVLGQTYGMLVLQVGAGACTFFLSGAEWLKCWVVLTLLGDRRTACWSCRWVGAWF